MDKIKILICDDEYATRLVTKAYLEEFNIEVLEAASGEEAESIIEREMPDLLIIDYSMPDKTGLEVIRELETVPPVIVVLTAEGFSSDIEAELKKNAAGYLVKPLTQEVLIKTVEKALGRSLDGR
ncbi:MAG: response regulator [Elusimicrobiota bacterium]